MTHSQTRRQERDERGVAIVTTALLLTAMLIVAGLVLDGGQNYSVRRKMQNASDSAAMAGAQAVFKCKIGGDSTACAAVDGLALDAAGRNGNNDAFECTVVQIDGTTPVPTSPSTCANTAAVADASAAGVSVRTKNTRNLSFGAFLGANTQSVRASAAATVQPLLAGPAPFYICGTTGGYDILAPPSTPGGLPTLDEAKATAQYGYNQTPPKQPIAIQDNGVPDCGAQGGQFDGKGKGTTLELGQFGPIQPGNGSNDHAAYTQVVSAEPCTNPNEPVDCELLIPVIDSTDGGTGGSVNVRVVAWTVWHLEPGHGNTKFEGWFVGKALMTAGQTMNANCTANSGVCVVKLRA